ncbi:MAG: 50S ribosomal protein L6 [Candidatus Krumholzibacteriales bacterium]
MSRVGKEPIPVPPKVEVDISGGNEVRVKGPRGELAQSFDRDMIISLEDNVITVRRPTESKRHRSIHGLTRSLISNMVEGVSRGFEKALEIEGREYKVQKKGNTLELNLGFSHPVNFPIPPDVDIEVLEDRKFKVTGADKQKVGEIAAEIRALRPPEPYKGKGIRYAGEYIKRKAGKAAVGTGF